MVIDAFFDLADAIITVRSLIRQAWTATAGTAPGMTIVIVHLSVRPLTRSR